MAAKAKNARMDFFEALDPLLRTFWYIALPTSLIFVIQSIMTFAGVDHHDGADFSGGHPHDGGGHDGGFQWFTLRNLINFLLGFSWSGISFYELIPNIWLLLLVCVQMGALMVGLFFVLVRQLNRLAEDNSFQMAETVGKVAEVYLPIPGQQQGMGKVLVSVKGSVHELAAATRQEARIESGAKVKVVGLEADDCLLVEKL